MNWITGIQKAIDYIEEHLTEEIERRDGLVYKAKTRSALIGLGFKESELDYPVKNLAMWDKI